MKRIFPAVKLRPQTPPIDKREIGNAAIPWGRQNIYLSLSPPNHPQLGKLANEHAVSSDVTACDFAHCGQKELHHFLQVLFRGLLPLFSIVTQCYDHCSRSEGHHSNALRSLQTKGLEPFKSDWRQLPKQQPSLTFAEGNKFLEAISGR